MALIKLKPRAWEILERSMEALRAAGISSGPVFRQLRHCAPDPEQPTAPRR